MSTPPVDFGGDTNAIQSFLDSTIVLSSLATLSAVAVVLSTPTPPIRKDTSDVSLSPHRVLYKVAR